MSYYETHLQRAQRGRLIRAELGGYTFQFRALRQMLEDALAAAQGEDQPEDAPRVEDQGHGFGDDRTAPITDLHQKAVQATEVALVAWDVLMDKAQEMAHTQRPAGEPMFPRAWED